MENSLQTGKANGHGGARPGAGRKRVAYGYYGFRATKEADEILQKVEGSKSAFINQCIVDYAAAHSLAE